MEISADRLKELERIEIKMNALEAGGVDNWEFYGDALTEFNKMVEFDENIEKKFDEICEVLCEKIEEPAGRGCGYGLNSKQMEIAFNIFKDFVRQIKK